MSEHRTRRLITGGVVLLALFVVACGGKASGKKRADGAFSCDDRRVAYIGTGLFAGPEVGVVISCAERGPQIRRWVVLDESGSKQDGARSLTPGEFDELWTKIDGTGWHNLSDCDNPNAGDGDPSYKIGIKNQQMAVSLSCTGNPLPFPFDRIVNELDLLVGKYSL